MIERLKVIVTAIPTYLGIVALGAPIVAQEAAKVLPTPWAERTTTICLTVAAVCTAIIVTIRRVTPVAKAERGLLP